MKPTPASAQLRRIFVLLAATFVVFELVALTGIAPPPHAALALAPVNRFLGAAFAASFLFFLRARPDKRDLALALGLAALIEAVSLAISRGHGSAEHLALVGFSLGQGSLIVLALRALRSPEEARQSALDTLIPAASLPLFVALTKTGLALTVALHPITFDLPLYQLDASLGGQASFAVGRVLRAAPPLGALLRVVYLCLPLSIGVVYTVVQRSTKAAGADFLGAILAAGAAGFALYHVCPVAGPRYLFDGLEGVFPDKAPPAAELPLAPGLLSPFDRNGVPSLHTAWALLLVWHARPHGLGLRLFTIAWLALTLLATLGLGEHYLLDLVIAVPFTVAVDAALLHGVPFARWERSAALTAGVTFTLAWFLLLRNGVHLLVTTPVLLRAIVLVTVLVPWLLHHRLRLRASALAEDARAAETPRAEPSPVPVESAALARRVGLVFFCSGFAGLVYEVVFGKSLGLTFGNTAQASAVVLATYMGGMALGAWAGGRLGAKRSNGLQIYAYCELGIAVWCALSPLLFSAIRMAYVALASGVSPSSPLLGVLQAVLGALIILPATFLMGVTMPVLSRTLLRGDAGLGWAIGMLYGANTLGAAAGAFLTGYFLLPFFGVTYATWLAVMLNLCVALIGLRLAKGQPAAPASEPTERPDDSDAVAASGGEHRRGRALALAILIGGGAITLALEVTYTHLLAVVAGNSAYAFSLMLFTFLVGLGLGSALMRRFLGARSASLVVVGVVELGLAVAILAGVFVWEAIPGYFATFARYPSATHFGERELIRFVVCCVAMVPPAVCIGALYPAALECASRGHPRGAVFAIGRASALNTLGNILGAVAGSFLLLPSLGSLRALQALAAFAALLGLLPLLVRAGKRLPLFVPLLAVLALSLVQPKRFDLDRLASGANVYFSVQSYGKVIDHAESTAGGLTTVAASEDADGSTVLTLLTNGKFQGDNSPDREMRAQYGFGLCPLLHTTRRDDALVVGFGVGGTSRALRDAGFARTDVVELSDDVLRLAKKHFSGANGAVLDDPSVRSYVTDGRNYLLLQQRSYDVISIEVSSIWFAGAASLYNQELYALARKRLRPQGVLQQWVQLHHIAQEDLVSVLATVRAEFPIVWLYFTGNQGLIVACGEECAPGPATVAAIDQAPRLREVIPLFDGSVQTLRKDLLLDPASVDRLLHRWNDSGGSVADLVSTDDNMRLEYTTPRGNVMLYGPSLEASITFLTSQGRPTVGAPPQR